ncbi:Gfo/Idh/MocA family protein [Paenibacillus spongiae]|uniref:Gfo/Idh/MocA family oxidoreductase n=1 Tax=Paenibacillus spongiae TaxID=2909671 RepID=A0ABY5SHW5_9BACL|nr:Gfo/Idh/MocA family oxidoreductase [Paenibacillus spongiae]UVI33596.1 Gfo/Idh/MocA family oxidoreductase [Paenibacillus spongiae]
MRVGVVGVGRGSSFYGGAQAVGMELVAICDVWEERLQQLGQEFGVTTYADYDQFLRHDMDAVILANFFHEHAPFAIRALEAGKHVMSETSACKTLKEGVALARAVEKSGKIYMMAENYPYFVYNQEMRRLYQEGHVGELQFGEGEYIHPCSAEEMAVLGPGLAHWRNHRAATYYCTHALAPIMFITDRRPTSVNALCIPFMESDTQKLLVRHNDSAATIMLRMDNEAVVTLNGVTLRGHGNWYRIHGTRGQMENMRTGDPNRVRLRHEPYDLVEGEELEKIYLPEFPVHPDLAQQAGHGGGDFFTNYYFAEAIRKNEQPYLDVYRALDMTIVGIQAYRSALANGAPFEIPDFRDESVRMKYENDDWSPFFEDRRPGQPFPSYQGEKKPSEEAVAYARSVWKRIGREDVLK